MTQAGSIDPVALQADPAQAIAFYQEQIAAQPDMQSHYWHLGLAYLLHGEETEAQTTWMLALMAGDDEQLPQWTAELVAILHQEAGRQTASNPTIAWAIRQHIRELDPSNLINVLHLIELSIELKTFQPNDLINLGAIELLRSGAVAAIDGCAPLADSEPPKSPILGDFEAQNPPIWGAGGRMQRFHDQSGNSCVHRSQDRRAEGAKSALCLPALKSVLREAPDDEAVLEFATVCLEQAAEPTPIVLALMDTAIWVGHELNQPLLGIRYIDLCLRIYPDNLNLLSHVTYFYQNANQHDRAIAIAQRYCTIARELPDQIFGAFLMMRALMREGNAWDQVQRIFEHQETLIAELTTTTIAEALQPPKSPSSGGLSTSELPNSGGLGSGLGEIAQPPKSPSFGGLSTSELPNSGGLGSGLGEIAQPPKSLSFGGLSTSELPNSGGVGSGLGEILLLDQMTVFQLSTSTFCQPYLRDSLAQNRQTQNRLMQVCQASIHSYARERADRYQQGIAARRQTRNVTKPLRIGYVSHCLKRHSVGWLSRWLFEHHDRDRFEIYAFFWNAESGVQDELQHWFVQHVDQARFLARNSGEIADRIFEDEIDLLIDLDSITADILCEVLALKPAPIQATWLGWDASGIPAIDYFIADPYVLPETADAHYSEKIWRLPQTYIAVDGFEIGVPSLRREQLNIPPDAIIYWSGQASYKRHPVTVQAQLQILKAVPNSYLLIKGLTDEASIQRYFTEMAIAIGVDPARLRFLPDVALEAVHRANLEIADVVLDTYPYNGATTTLETLWVGVPIVTRVGEHFSSRNSYTMMINAGITEGIAWSEAEYVDWGIRFGIDPTLRQQVTWKLRQSRQTAPLWNAKQFTRHMETAYEQMWQHYWQSPALSASLDRVQ